MRIPHFLSSNQHRQKIFNTSNPFLFAIYASPTDAHEPFVISPPAILFTISLLFNFVNSLVGFLSSTLVSAKVSSNVCHALEINNIPSLAAKSRSVFFYFLDYLFCFYIFLLLLYHFGL